jgi:hypothetical protein
MSGDRMADQATKLSLIGVFLATLAAFSTRRLSRGTESGVRPYDLLLLGLATFRTGRVLAFEQVAEPLREPFTTTQPDQYGAGENVVAQGAGMRKALGQLLSCPLCTGTWVALGLLCGLHLAPRPTRAFLAVMGASGIAELLNAATEAMTWAGQAARKRAGDEETGRQGDGGKD